MLKIGAELALMSARERMIGWYTTGPKLRASDQEINELFKRFVARPVMVIVDVRPHTVGIPTDAYFAVEEIKDVRVSSASEDTPSKLRSFLKRCCRMVQKHERLSSTSPPPLKPKNPRRSGSSTSCAISKIPPPPRSPHE